MDVGVAWYSLWALTVPGSGSLPILFSCSSSSRCTTRQMQMNVYLAWPLAGANTFLSAVHARTPRLSERACTLFYSRSRPSAALRSSVGAGWRSTIWTSDFGLRWAMGDVYITQYIQRSPEPIDFFIYFSRAHALDSVLVPVPAMLCVGASACVYACACGRPRCPVQSNSRFISLHIHFAPTQHGCGESKLSM
jgi:hypothetical protein